MRELKDGTLMFTRKQLGLSDEQSPIVGERVVTRDDRDRLTYYTVTRLTDKHVYVRFTDHQTILDEAYDNRRFISGYQTDFDKAYNPWPTAWMAVTVVIVTARSVAFVVTEVL